MTSAGTKDFCGFSIKKLRIFTIVYSLFLKTKKTFSGNKNFHKPRAPSSLLAKVNSTKCLLYFPCNLLSYHNFPVNVAGYNYYVF